VGLRVITTLPAVTLLLAIGWSIAIAGLAVSRLEIILLGTVIGGIGQAGGYRVALAYITIELTPIQQGRVAATFSAFAYSGAGVMVLLDGIAGELAGTIGGAVAIGVVYSVTSVVAIALVLRRKRRTPWPPVTRPADRETADTASPSVADDSAGQQSFGR